MFENRTTAGTQLAEKLDRYFSVKHPPVDSTSLLIVGLPRGGVPVALEVARRFHCPLDVLVSKKIPCPGQPEYAIGAVSSDGIVVLNPDIPKQKQWMSYVEDQREQLIAKTMDSEKYFHVESGTTGESFHSKIVVIVDDGIATGMTAKAALETAHGRGAAQVILATPVMSTESYYSLRGLCDEVIAISVPERFSTVGQHYLNFEQTSDDEVIAALREGATLRHVSHAHQAK